MNPPQSSSVLQQNEGKQVFRASEPRWCLNRVRPRRWQLPGTGQHQDNRVIHRLTLHSLRNPKRDCKECHQTHSVQQQSLSTLIVLVTFRYHIFSLSSQVNLNRLDTYLFQNELSYWSLNIIYASIQYVRQGSLAFMTISIYVILCASMKHLHLNDKGISRTANLK